MTKIRNFCIIAHIDHGKSTLADRLLEFTGAIAKRDMKAQLLDTMELEQERGITIKLQPVRMDYCPPDASPAASLRGPDDASNVRSSTSPAASSPRLAAGAPRTDKPCYILNLIDTPGHVDFTYEVSRSLAAVEGAILLVDASQGVQAQTIANLYQAVEQGLTIIPVLNKIDLPAADVEKVTAEVVALLGCKADEIISVSAKTGENIADVVKAVIERVPPPDVNETAPLKALVFDSVYDEYKGVVAYIRVMDGSFKKGKNMLLIQTATESEVLEVGVFRPKYESRDTLSSGEIGYVVTGLKDIEACRVGDTITLVGSTNIEPLKGYKEVKPMVFAGLYPKEGDEYQRLRDALARLKLSDAALLYEPEHSAALGFGFRCGLLGLLHLEILQERIRREFDMELVVTVPSVAYRVLKTKGNEIIIKSPLDLPDPTHIDTISEPWVKIDIVTPKQFIGAVMSLVVDKRGNYKTTEYLTTGGEGSAEDVLGERVILRFEMPLASILVDFYDKLKSVTSGYASLNYEFMDYRQASVVRMDILVAEEPVEALAVIVYRDEAERIGRAICRKLRDTLPREQFVIKIQAAIGGKIVAAERLSALRKDVTAKLYGGDVTRKRKLLEKQKKGKKRMKAMGHGKVDIPPEAFLAVLKRDS